MTAAPGLEIFLADESATLALGKRLAKALAPGMYIALQGELGSGKTTLARGLLRGLGYEGRVKSPTYTLVELYKLSKLDLYHFDFYRFGDPRDLIDAGLREAFDDAAVCVVEWPEKAAEHLPRPDLRIRLNESHGGRIASITAETEAGRSCLAQLQN
ncbi:MAG TPA: tRNA (adenosine(37)-N6)-threonylcarbamoyltransferase complex ATPase subunit type 1 TsaE [Burkholderiales bacterium]|nr:tRNA (adenosine(37)-N6)-threonylcarbamoyltransferase complex ATPase subunit type 1 TsaE [Burkholderiales bacterium]